MQKQSPWQSLSLLHSAAQRPELPITNAEAVKASAAIEKMAARRKCMIKRRAELQWKSCFLCWRNLFHTLLIRKITLPKSTSGKRAGSTANRDVDVKSAVQHQEYVSASILLRSPCTYQGLSRLTAIKDPARWFEDLQGRSQVAWTPSTALIPLSSHLAQPSRPFFASLKGNPDFEVLQNFNSSVISYVLHPWDIGSPWRLSAWYMAQHWLGSLWNLSQIRNRNWYG